MNRTPVSPAKKDPGPWKQTAVRRMHSLRVWIRWAAHRIATSGVRLDTGLQEPYLEAEYLVCFAISLDFDRVETHLDRIIQPEMGEKIVDVLSQRIQQRQPAAYITGEAFFAGYRFQVDPRVLIPRSRIENLFDDEEGFDALLDPTTVRHILDLGTGSGCLAAALAFAFPGARVDAADLSEGALAVAAENRHRLNLDHRIRLIHSDLFQNLPDTCYDLIVTNPPYVPRSTLDGLPAEYGHEPRVALDGGADGLELVSRILSQAPRTMTDNALMICEVGDETEEILREQWPDLPAEWLYFHFGGSGVFTIHKRDLVDWNRSREEAGMIHPTQPYQAG